MEKLEALKNDGNLNFKNKNYEEAINCYTEGIKILE